VLDVQHRDFSLNGTSGAVMKPFVMQQVVRTECCELEGYEDFCITARVNLTNDERDALSAANDEVITYSDEWLALPEEERDQEDTPHRRQMALVAPFIVGWNAHAIDAVTGEIAPVPPPAEGGAAVFDLIFPDLTEWIRRATLNSYLSGKGLNIFGRVSRR